MTKCLVCGRNSSGDDYCGDCDYILFMLDEIIESFFNQDSDLINLNVLKEFSWIYAGYPRLWSYYNSMIDVMFYFFSDPTKDYITIDEISTFENSKLDNPLLIELLEKSRIIIIDELDRNRFNIGQLTDIIKNDIFLTLPLDSPEARRKIQELFGILSISLTRILIDRNTISEEEGSTEILPRKALSVMNALISIINESGADANIGHRVRMSIFADSQRRFRVSNQTKLKIIYEMMGLSPSSPGETNIIREFDVINNEFVIKNNIIELLEFIRERKRIRDRERIR